MPFRLISLLSLFGIFMVLKVAAAEKGRPAFNELVVDGIRRSYLVYEPLTSNKNELPLMIVLHGGLGNAKHIMKKTAMNGIADSGPFVVVYPNGIKRRFVNANRRTWNAGGCCGLAVKKNVDDVKFIKKIIEDIAKKISIDTRRVYVAGMSNGAMMAYRLAAEIPDKIAAIIAVAGTMAVDSFDAAKDIAVMHIHGTEDKHVPVKGGVGPMSVAGVAHRSVSDTVKLITRSRQCLAPEVRTESGGVRITSYRGSNGAPVVIVLIEGEKHAWPGGHGRRHTDSGGRHFSASKAGWEFAKQFSKISK